MAYYKRLFPLLFFEIRRGKEDNTPRIFKTPFCIANYIGGALKNTKDALSFVQFFIDFCSSEEASDILLRYTNERGWIPFYTLQNTQKYLKIYKNSLLISAHMKNVLKRQIL